MTSDYARDVVSGQQHRAAIAAKQAIYNDLRIAVEALRELAPQSDTARRALDTITTDVR